MRFRRVSISGHFFRTQRQVQKTPKTLFLRMIKIWNGRSKARITGRAAQFSYLLRRTYHEKRMLQLLFNGL